MSLIDESGEDTLAINAGTFDRPYYSLIFIGITAKGDFFFINRPDRVYEFKRDRWKEWLKDMEPYTFHCFMVEGYKTKTSASGAGFRPVQWVCELPGIRVAKVINSCYLERWQQFHDADEDTVTDSTREFVDYLGIFVNDGVNPLMRDLAHDAALFFANPETQAHVAWAMNVHMHPPFLNWAEMVDAGPLVDMYIEWLSTQPNDVAY